jgi:predicted nucleic acid-binding protein
MSAVTVDASVWIATQDPSDAFCAPSRAFLTKALTLGTTVHVSSYARVEVACALARRLRHAAKGQKLTDHVLAAASAREMIMDAALLARASSVGTSKFLRGADALYAAAADLTGSLLVSWDQEHIQRAGGLSPTD